MICPKCNGYVDNKAVFCEACGCVIKREDAACVNNSSELRQGRTKTAMCALIKKCVIAALTAMLILAGVVIGIVSGGTSDHALYIKTDGQLWYNTISDKADRISTRLMEGMGAGFFEYKVRNLSCYFTVSDNEKRIFYIDECSTDGEDVSKVLYTRSLSNTDGDALRIDSGVGSYVISDDANVVTYIKQEKDTLCQYNVKQEQCMTVQEGVLDFTVTKNGKKILYLTEDKDIYLKESGKEAIKVDSAITNIYDVNKSLSKLYYLKDGNLYLNKNGKKSELLSEDVHKVLGVYDSGEVYYTKLKQADNNARPEATVTEGFDAQMAFDKYLDGLYKRIELYYYDGKRSVMIADVHGAVEDVYKGNAMLSYICIDTDSVNISELTEENFYERMHDLTSTKNSHIVIKDKVYKIDNVDGAGIVRFTDDGKKAYFFADIEGIGFGDMYEVSVNGKPGKPMLIDTDVYAMKIVQMKNGGYAYFKNVQHMSYAGDLYIDKKAADTDVKLYSCEYSEGLDRIVYFKDYDDDEKEGVLNCASSDGEVSLISGYAHSFHLIDDGSIIYLYEYDDSSMDGDLYVSYGERGVKLDTNVSIVIERDTWTRRNNIKLGYKD